MATKLKKNNIVYTPVVEGISRKFTTRDDKSTSPLFTGFMGAVSKQVNIAGVGTSRKNYYFFRKAKFSVAQTEDAINGRNLFAQVGRAVPVLVKNLTYMARMLQMWNQARVDMSKKVNGVSAYGYQSLRSWVFACQYAGKLEDENYNLNQWPNNFDA